MTRDTALNLDANRIRGRRVWRKPTSADREQLIRIYESLSVDGQRMAIFMMRAIGREEGLIVSDAPLVKVEKA